MGGLSKGEKLRDVGEIVEVWYSENETNSVGNEMALLKEIWGTISE